MSGMVSRLREAVLAEYLAVATEAMSGGAVGFSHDLETSERIARAAILALREPTEAMLRAAFVAMNETPGGTWKQMKAEGVTPRRLFDIKMAPRFRAMIDAILDEPQYRAGISEGGNR